MASEAPDPTAPAGVATPRPWIAADDSVTEAVIICQSRYGNGGFIGVVAIADYSMEDNEGALISRANAALIIRAVNSHDELVASLKSIMACFAPDGLALTADEMQARYEAARASLAAATGEPT